MKKLINYLSKKSLSLGNGSGMTRKWFGNDSGMTRFSLASLICLCMLTVGVGNAWGTAASLPVDYSFGAGSSSLPTGVTGSGLGSDYAVGNSPYRLKCDNNGDYIQIEVDGPVGAITIGIKQFASTAPTFQIKGSETANGTYTLIQSWSINPGQNNTATRTTSNAIDGDYRFFRIIKSSGGNAGIGTLAMTKGCTSLTQTTVTASPGNAQIVLSWAPVTNASSYTVTCKRKSDSSTAGISVGGVSGSNPKTCTITGVSNGTAYTWSVMPVGTSTYCAENTPATGDATPNVTRTITYYDKDGSHTTSLADGTNIATALTALYGGDDPVSCDATNYEYFVGWKVGEISGTASSVTLLDDEVVNASSPSNNYYAVWSDTDPSAGGSELFSFDGGVAADLTDMTGVTAGGLGTDYAASNAPYRIKLDGTGDYVIIAIASQPSKVTIGVKMIGGNSTSSITVQESTAADGTFTDVEELSISGAQNDVLALETSESFKATTRAVKLYFTKGSNVGLGPITIEGAAGDAEYITTCCTDPELAYATGSVTKTYGAGVFTNALTNSHSIGVTYDSSDKTVATVDSEGEVTILKAGTTTISASFAGNSTYCADEASYTLTVNKANISPSLSYSSTTLVIGNNSSSPTVGGNSGSGTVTYAITTESTSGVVTLNTSTGVVTAAKEGTATITATIPATTNYNGGSATANFTVTCGAPSSVDIDGDYQFYPGETIELTATPTGGAGTPVTYQWKKGGSPIAGATSATYTKNNATASDAGAYTCTVQYGSNCATTSDAFNLKCMQFYLKNNSGEDISNHALTKVDATHATLSLSLTGGTTYKFRVTDGCGDWYGNTGEMTSSNCTNWPMDADNDCRITTSSKSATYVFNFDFSGGLLGTEMRVSVVYPSSNQASGKVIYWDNEVNKWNGSKLWYRIGKSTHNSNTQLSKVAGTANFYSVTTSQYDGFEYWHIANNVGQGTGNIFWTKDNSGSGLEITNAMGFEGAPVTDATVTVTPTTTHSTGGSSDNNNCEFYTYSITSGVKSYTVTSSATNCTVAMEKYNTDNGSSTTALASGGTVMPTQYVKVTVTPNTGYQFSSVSVTNGTTVTAAAAGTPGVYYITGNATVTATCTVKSCTVNFDKNSGTGGDASTTATYGSAMTTVTAPTRTGYTFDGYWDAETDNDGSGTQYYLANGTSARDWDKDVTAAQTLYAKWNAKEYTITLDREGASSGATSVTATFNAGTLAGWSAPSKTGYTFGGYWSGDNGTGTLVISTTGVLQNSVTISAVAWTDGSGHWVKDGGATVYAKWTANVYNITYKDQGNVAYSGNATDGVPTGAPTTHTYGSATALVNGVKDGYRFDGWFTDASCTVSAGSSIGATAVTADFTLYAKWTQVYTVTWSVNGETWSSGVVEGNTHVPGGSKVSALPTAPTKSDCDDSKVFVGWKAAEIDGTSVSDPGGIFTTQGTSPDITGKTDFYAVFADENGGDNTLVTNVSELTVGTQVYFYAETSDDPAFTAVMKAYESGNNVRAVSGSVSNNKLTPSDGACLYTIGTAVYSETTGYTFNDGTNYLYAASTSSNHLKSRAAIEADGWAIFSISITDGVASISSIGNTSRGVLQFNKNNDTGDYTAALFACYASEANTRQNVQIFKKNPLVYSNYVTTCASCDGDATFTNTTPAVSAIGCTGATLTATGGLATLGAAGCNVSDYGFVIGTADNPAIGGVGVTKYQVGTTNPTTGEDFSYDATGLTKGTHYYIRAYAKNGHGTAYSSSQNFWTKEVSSIAITTAPTKTNYIVGETFDATGMVVTATMASGATEDVTSDVTYSTDALTAGTNKDFAINYTLCETDKIVNQKINVYTLSVSEGTNPSYGSYTVDGAVITVSLEAQKTFSFATTNCSTRDNGDGTYTVINVTGNATVVINYRNAVQVKVYYKVDGTTITSLTQDVYESSQTTLPTASALSSAMAAQGMALPDELYPNFIGWSETEFGAQTADPTIVEGTPVINAEKNYYAVYSNVNKIRIDESDITSTSYPGSEQTLTKSSKDFKYHYVCKNSTYYLQFKKNGTQFGYIYNNTAISNIAKIEIGASGDNDFVPVYAGSAANTISGSALEDENTSETKYIYLFPSNTQYFIIKGDNSYTYKVNYIDIYYASSTVYYMTQFCTRYAVTGASTGGTAVIVNGNTGGTLTSSHNELCEGKNLTLSATVNTQYSFGEWKIVKTGAEPEVDLTADLLGANKTSLTPPAFAMPGYGITVSATISEKTATAWNWTYNSAAIPDPMILYVGEVKQLDVTYTPDASQLVADQKNYSVEKESSVAQVSKTANYYRMRGAAGVTVETNTNVTFSLNSLSQVVNVTVRPLPSATFEDNVHNAISTTVTATVTDGVVSLTKKTPTHADVAAPVGGNECETTHLHLVGWIDGDWEPFINYMNGGSRPSDSDITSATGYFYLPNADIDLSVKGGKTYYAVWGKVDE